ncbi:hypothetical protein ABIF70_009826 [Bradyrhizobium japonicum]
MRAGGASVRHAGPVGDGRIDIVEIGDMNLPVLGHDGAGHVAAADLELGERHAGADAHGAVADPDHPGPPVAFRNVNGGARRAEQMHGRFRDLLQRALRIARGVGDGAQDLHAGVLAVARNGKLGLQAGILRRLGSQLPFELGGLVLGRRGH